MWMNTANGLIILVMTLLAAWLMASSMQRVMLRLIMALVCTGGLADMSALYWVGYPQVWPGELVTNIGLVLLLLWLVVQPLLARPAAVEEQDVQVK